MGSTPEACKILAEIGTKESKAVLLGACEDTSAFVVMEAKRAITLLAQRLGEQPPNLEPKPIPDMNLTELLAELKKPKTYRHQEILNRLGQMKVDPAHRVEVVKILESLLVGDDAMLRGACLKALGVWGNKDNVPALLKFLKDPSPFVRGPTITALVTIGDDRAVVPLIERLEDSFDRNAASQAIQKMGSSKHEKTVWPYLEHKDVWVKLEAIKILARSAPRRARPCWRPRARTPMASSSRKRKRHWRRWPVVPEWSQGAPSLDFLPALGRGRKSNGGGLIGFFRWVEWMRTPAGLSGR